MVRGFEGLRVSAAFFGVGGSPGWVGGGRGFGLNELVDVEYLLSVG